jgi:hypothetical protein
MVQQTLMKLSINITQLEVTSLLKFEICYFFYMAVIWDLAPHSREQTELLFRGAMNHSLDDGGSKHLCNVKQFL